MNIQPFQIGNTNEWVIAANPVVTMGRRTAEGFWNETDQRWSPTPGPAKRFQSYDEALAYLRDNYGQLSTTDILY